MAKEKASRTARFWLVCQHEDASIVESDDMPPTAVEAGERMKAIRGPFNTKELASKASADYTSRTLSARAGR